MKNKLPSYIDSYSFGSRKIYSDLIVEAKRDKRNISDIAKKLVNSSALNRYVGIGVQPYTSGNVDTFIDFFRNMNIETVNYFDSMNLIGSTLNSIIDVLGSEVAKLEKNIKELEIYVDNFSFISGEDDLFNGSFVETFSDDSNLFKNDNYLERYKDRDGSYFVDNEIAMVDIVSGTMKNGNSFLTTQKNPTIKEYRNNYNSYISSSSNIENIFSDNSFKSWNVTIKCPTILRSRITDFETDIGYDYSQISGANASMVFDFDTSQKINCIRVSPNMGLDFQLVQVILYPLGSDQREKILVLNSPLLIDSVKDISFEERTIKSVKLIFNQPRYKRIQLTASSSEQQAKIFNDYISKIREARKNSHDKLQDIVYSYFLIRNNLAYQNSNPRYVQTMYTYRYPCSETEPVYGSLSEFLSDKKSFVELDAKNKFSSNNPVTIFVESIVSYVLGSKYRMSPSVYISTKNSFNPLKVSDVDHNGAMPISGYTQPHSQSLQGEPQLVATSGLSYIHNQLFNTDINGSYEYSMSIKSIKFGNIINSSTSNTNIGNNLKQSKTFFISKRIQTGGYIGALKVKSVDEIPKSTNPNLDLKETAAIEYSVTVSPDASEDSAWTPILPYGQENVTAELLIPTLGNGRCRLRFAAVFSSLVIYENGKKIPLSRTSADGTSLGRIITISSFNPSKVYVASYKVDRQITDPNIVDFSLVSGQSFYSRIIFDQDGTGEPLSTQGSENRATLTYDPYIDYSKFSSDYSYSDFTGMNYNGTKEQYIPIQVKMEDGSYAINLTNYLPNKNVKYTLPTLGPSQTYFIQQGKNLVFNKSVKNFRAIYEYIPENMRYKIVTRSLNEDTESSAYVDNFVLKYQIKKTDSFSDKLLKVV